jgi:transposase, IS6 family
MEAVPARSGRARHASSVSDDQQSLRGLRRFRSAARIAAGQAFLQNLRRGHYEIATDVPSPLGLATAFSELALAM